MTDTAQQRYLRTVRTELSDLPANKRDMVVADVQAHIDEATDAGMSVESALTSLGPARELAARARIELRAVVPSLARGVWATRISVVGALVLGVLTALVVAFAAPLWGAVDRTDTGQNPPQLTIEQSSGPWVALIALAPALLAALALILPRRAGQVVLIVLAGVMTATFGLGATLAGWYLPFIAQLWVCVLVPIAVSRGFDLAIARVWRIGIGLTLVIPAGVILIRGVTAPAGLGALYVTAFVVSLLLAVFIVLGVRVFYLLLSVVGLVLMVASTLLPATFPLVTWWLGGAFFVLGMASTASSWPTGPRRSNA